MHAIELVDRPACPLCGSGSRSTHVAFPDIPVVRCLGCGFIYSARLMAPANLNAYYADNFGSERRRRGQLVNARTNRWAIGRLLDLRAITTLLDVGTGYGFLIKELKDRYGLQARGVELSVEEAEYGRNRLSLDIRTAALADSGLPRAHFDVVSCFEVIEHTPDPLAFVRELADYARPGGHVLVMTDNFESAVVKRLGADFPKWIPHAHVSHFGPDTLRRTLEAAGLTLQGSLSYTPWELRLRERCYRLLGIARRPEQAFELAGVLRTEMGGRFRLFGLRRLANSVWARLTARPDPDGALMYLLARRDPGH